MIFTSDSLITKIAIVNHYQQWELIRLSIHNDIMFKDTTTMLGYNKAHFQIGKPYLAIIASKMCPLPFKILL